MGSHEFETCAICMSGFYMNETQNCVRASYNNWIRFEKFVNISI